MDVKIYTEIIGYAAAFIGTCIFLPQVIKSWTSKRTKDVSLLSFLLIAIGSVLWVIYGLLIQAIPIALVNAVILVLSLIMLYLKRKYG